MKKLYIFLFVFLTIFSSGCKSNKTAEASQLDLAVLQELEQIENIESLDDETIKALSVIVRTKHKNNSQKSKLNYKPKNEKILKLVKMSKNDILKNENPNTFFAKSKTWKKIFEKHEIFKILSNNNISLSSLSQISPGVDENQNMLGVFFGQKFIDSKTVAEMFELESENIVSVSLLENQVVFEGVFSKEQFFIEDAEVLSKKGYNYKDIIKHFYGIF